MPELNQGAVLSTGGITFNTVVVPETGDFHNGANEWRHYVAGARIPRSEAIAFGIVEGESIDPPSVEPLTDAELGEQYGRCLEAAGFAVHRTADIVALTAEPEEFSPADQGELLAGWLKEAGYVLTKSDTAPQTAAEQDRADAAARRAAKAAAKDVDAKAEPAPSNKAEPDPGNKSE